MGFFLSKLAGALTTPGNWAIGVLLAALWMTVSRRPPGRVLSWAVRFACVFLLAVWALPVDWVFLKSLEHMVPAAPLPAHVDGIIVLGGWAATNPEALGVNDATERFIEGVGLARRYPAAKLVFTGGSADPFRQDIGEFTSVRLALDRIGFPMDRVVVEERSRDTWENAVLSKQLVKPGPDEVWILVTSAFHMPRSMAVFRKVGWKVLPYPCDYRTGSVLQWSGRSFLERIDKIDIAAHEWVGFLGYWAIGRI